MNRFGGADLLIHSSAHGGLDARYGRYFDHTHRGDLPHRVCPQGGGVIVVTLYDILDDGLRPGRT